MSESCRATLITVFFFPFFLNAGELFSALVTSLGFPGFVLESFLCCHHLILPIFVQSQENFLGSVDIDDVLYCAEKNEVVDLHS